MDRPQPVKPRILFSAIAAMMGVGLLGRLAFIGYLSEGENFMAVVPDDTFYYLAIARNVAEGYGSTFDRLAPTNGYHPLWLLVLVPLFLLPIAKLWGVLVAMGLSGSIWVAGAPFLFRGACRWFRAPEPALVLVGLYLFTPAGVLFSINGLETSLVVVLTIAFIDWLGRSVERYDALPTRFYACYGIWAGAIFLARTDSIFLLAAVTATPLLGGLATARKVSLRGAATAFVSASVVAGPWLLWNLSTFGELVQSSGKALPWIYHEFARKAEFLDTADVIRRGVLQVREAAVFTWEMAGLPAPPGNFSRSVAPGVAVVWLVIACYRHGRKRPDAWPQIAAVAAICFTLAFHAGVRWYPREWYFALPVLSLYGVLTFAAYRLAGRWILTAGAIACVLAAGTFHWRHPGPYPAQVGAWAGAENHDRHLAAGELLGSTDAGTSGYVIRRGAVVNLDGLVNSEILPYYRAGNTADYIRSRQIPTSYLRPPFFHPIFTGPGRLYLFGTQPHDTPQLYRLMDTAEMLSRQFPTGPVAFGSLDANKYAGPGWEMPGQDLPFRTARGPRSEIFLPLHAETAYTLSLELRAALPDASIELAVFAAGERVGGTRLQHDWTNLTAELPEVEPILTVALKSARFRRGESGPVRHGEPSIQVRTLRIVPSGILPAPGRQP